MSKAQLKLKNEKVTVTSAGTAVRLKSSSQMTWGVLIQASASNTGIIYAGNNGSDDITSTEGYVLYAGQTLPVNSNQFFSAHVEYVDLSNIWIDASVSGESVIIMYTVTAETL